ncbi:TnpV protein [Eubacterium coprostanoligenes]|uniref:TnpV protein n=1 Tax=Eubacterium coprostanoligenes TaxID=290054 RepID=UPI0023528F0B|nr:TnpV protein [Eubacterium coprostanoligenes]MCI6354350.1 TnpV protein [Eubacterium coprostanoligenes]
MKKNFTDEKTGISYTLVGDVYLPNLVSIDTNYQIGIWGKRHKKYLKENHKLMYFNLLTQGKLNSYLHDVDVRAKKMYDNLVTQLAEQEGVTEQLKATDMLAWVQAMNNISNCAREIVYNEIIYNY